MNTLDDGLDEEEEEEGELISEEECNNQLLEAARTSNAEQVEYWLSKKANINFMKDGWNPILWAACNGNEEVLRILIQHGGSTQYQTASKKQQDQDSEDEESKAHLSDEEEDYDPFVKPMDARKHGKYTPLHWASYKGYLKIVWILLKIGISPLDIDMYGNSSVHQAAASGNLEVLSSYLSRGVDVDMKNARGHNPLDLTTEPNTKSLIMKAVKTVQCETCRSKFDFKNIRYYCQSSQKFYCKNCSITTWVFEHYDSIEKERPVCRSKAVQKKVKDHEKKLLEAVETDDYRTVDRVLRTCTGIDIDVKLRRRADILHQKLEHELDIRTYLTANEIHDNYKLIRKDVQKINQLMEKAEELKIDLDTQLVEEVNAYTSRIISERNLRKQRDLFIDSISTCDNDKVVKLQGLIDVATENKVEESYIEAAKVLTDKMSGNILARETLQMLSDYPIREYPEIEDDSKKGKEKKAPKKKKKKEPPFATPEWALVLETVIEKVKLMDKLSLDKDKLKLSDEFIVEVQEQLQRFKKEISFRKWQEEQAAKEAELKALKKKKKTK